MTAATTKCNVAQPGMDNGHYAIGVGTHLLVILQFPILFFKL
ncbi:unnamed protein product [Dracunculus medinensis]|uniref:Uncharacterized protein n=1 Tax=Dracunculus medinensis TaxID=318479 RepID=A0A0N4UDT3_DRAME|nr:unnamed protein product [Dracunculus medinensis]